MIEIEFRNEFPILCFSKCLLIRIQYEESATLPMTKILYSAVTDCVPVPTRLLKN
jgi:hypothetical protein